MTFGESRPYQDSLEKLQQYHKKFKLFAPHVPFSENALQDI